MYGLLWCNVATDIPRQEAVAKILNLPQNIVPGSSTVIGKSNEDKPAKQRLEPEKIKHETWK